MLDYFLYGSLQQIHLQIWNHILLYVIEASFKTFTRGACFTHIRTIRQQNHRNHYLIVALNAIKSNTPEFLVVFNAAIEAC